MSGPLSSILGASRPRARPRLLALIDLVQDIDVMLPLLVALDRAGSCRLEIRVSRWLARESPRTAALLDLHGLKFRHVRRKDVISGRAPSLAGVAGVIAASESSHPAHAAGHALARRADAVGVKTYALQHGLENVGLFGLEAGAACFASRTVFCWFPPESTPADLARGTAEKLAHVGRCTPLGGWRRSAPKTFDVGVFENLHWDRYTDAERQGFLDGLRAVADADPATRILVRPHPAGGWADRLGHELARFPNITTARSDHARADPAGVADLVQGLHRVITTPSTIALDAALAGLPVALAVDGGSLYEPLPVLRTAHDWMAFATSGTETPLGLDQFRSRVLVDADAAPRMLERLRGDLAEHLSRNG